jgi:MFS family permease
VRFNPWRGIEDLPSNIWIVFAATLVNRAGTMALPFLVLYLMQRLDFPPTQAGLAIALYGLGSLIAAPLAGWLCDRVGPLVVIRSSLLVSGALLTTFPLAGSYAAILVLTFVWALVGEAYRPAGSAFLSTVVPPQQRKAAYAVYRLAVNLGMSIGPLSGGLLASHVSYSSLFWADGVTTILAGLVFMAARPGARQSDLCTLAAPSCPVKVRVVAWKDVRLLGFVVAILPVAMVFFQFEGALPLFIVRELGLSESVYGAIFLVNTVLIVLFEVPLNLATSGWPHRRLLAIGALLTAAGFGSLAFVSGVFGTVATIAVWTFGEMILLPGSMAYVADISPPERRGSYMGAYHVTFSLAFCLGPWIGIALFGRFGGTTVWATAFCAGTLSSLLLYRLVDETHSNAS